MTIPKKPRRSKAPRGKSEAPRASAAESVVEALREQLADLEEELRAEREARAADAADVGEMLARVARSEERARVAEVALEGALRGADSPKNAAAELEESVGRLWRELGVARREIDARADQLRKAEQAAADKARTYEKRIAELEERLRSVTKGKPTRPDMPAARASRAPPASDGDDEVSSLQAKLEEARADAGRMRENFEMLQTRAGKIGTGLREMRELMVQSAALFDDLEQREKAIAEIRAKSMRDARELFLRASGKDQEIGRPPPLPAPPKAPIEDLSEAAELLEEEIRKSTRPPPMEHGEGGDDDS
jgi:DNA repair exonuclease SbcCD ATPase subunit